MPFSPPEHNIEWIEWKDAFGQRETLDLHALSTVRLVTNLSVGWVIDEDDERILLAHSVSTSGEYDFQAIPKSWITNRVPVIRKRATRAKQTSKAPRRVPVSVDITETAGRAEPGPRA